ncbi:alcohol dehydrogenase [Gilvimarinus sp. F26214L]|uniref:alcohol dehydrogenase n=1 Tax=Gilvimarinus sp. DZF01 TaxID=3461371 RepID=UPI004045AB5C
MKSQAITALGQPLEEISKDTPQPKGGEVLVQTRHCGVCHSDLHLHDGYFDMGGGNKLQVKTDESLPFVLGHEVEGTVVAVGPDVQGVEVGKNYAVYPWIGCGRCGICESGREQLCTRPRAIGITVDGGYSDHVIVPDSKYLIDIGDLDGKLAACYMCSGITAYSAVRKLEPVMSGGPYMIIGLGGVGMMALQVALALYDELPIVADIDEKKLEYARSLGIKQAYNLKEDGVFKRIKAETDGGLAGIVDFVGSEKTVNPAVGLMRQGGKIVVVGLLGGALATPIPMLAFKALSIEGTYVGSLQDAKDVIALAQSGKLKPIEVSERPMSEANDVLESMRKGEILGRVVLKP